jgi:hypothetical protein
MVRFGIAAVFLALIPFSMTSHIDDVNGELSTFTFDKVVFRTVKDCSLDKMPGVSALTLKTRVKHPTNLDQRIPRS